MAVPKRPWVEREEALRLLLDAVAPRPGPVCPYSTTATRRKEGCGRDHRR